MIGRLSTTIPNIRPNKTFDKGIPEPKFWAGVVKS